MRTPSHDSITRPEPGIVAFSISAQLLRPLLSSTHDHIMQRIFVDHVAPWAQEGDPKDGMLAGFAQDVLRHWVLLAGVTIGDQCGSLVGETRRLSKVILLLLDPVITGETDIDSYADIDEINNAHYITSKKHSPFITFAQAAQGSIAWKNRLTSTVKKCSTSSSWFQRSWIV